MSIKYLFDDLKQLGKKKYFSRYNEEEVCYTGKHVQVEIIKCGGTVDLSLTVDGQKKNYLDSPYLSNNEKLQIKSVLSSYLSETAKANTISQILLSNLQIKCSENPDF